MPEKEKKILVIEDDPQLAELARYSLEDEDYQVIMAYDGSEGLVKARKEQPNLVMVDSALSGMQWDEVCQQLRADPITDHLPIVVMVDEHQLGNIEIGPYSNADDFLILPLNAAELKAKVEPLLFSAEDEQRMVITTGNRELDKKMGGGIPLGSLTLIEGDSGAGKSVLSQQMIHGSLNDEYRVTLFTTENTVKSLVKQMRSLGLDIIDQLLLDRLRIYPMETSQLGQEAPTILSQAMVRERGRDMMFVDSLTSAIPDSSDREVIKFFEGGKRLCANNTSVIIVVHSHALTKELLIRIRALCDAHLQLRTEEIGDRLVKTLEVTKVRGAEQTTGNIISFEVEPAWGIRVIPISKVRA